MASTLMTFSCSVSPRPWLLRWSQRGGLLSGKHLPSAGPLLTITLEFRPYSLSLSLSLFHSFTLSLSFSLSLSLSRSLSLSLPPSLPPPLRTKDQDYTTRHV